MREAQAHIVIEMWRLVHRRGPGFQFKRFSCVHIFYIGNSAIKSFFTILKWLAEAIVQIRELKRDRWRQNIVGLRETSFVELLLVSPISNTYGRRLCTNLSTIIETGEMQSGVSYVLPVCTGIAGSR